MADTCYVLNGFFRQLSGLLATRMFISFHFQTVGNMARTGVPYNIEPAVLIKPVLRTSLHPDTLRGTAHLQTALWLRERLPDRVLSLNVTSFARALQKIYCKFNACSTREHRFRVEVED